MSDPRPGGSPKAGEPRREIGSKEGSERHPPHVPEHDADADIQEGLPAESAVPILPANAAGSDKVTTSDQDEAVDEESMYDRRPERFLWHPPKRKE